MSQVVCEDLGKIKESRANEEDKEIDYGDVFPDLQKKDFVDKNVRIRPTSGITHADETKDGRQSNVSKGAGDDGEEGQTDNWNKYAALELEDQRKAIKRKKMEVEDEIKRKEMLKVKEAEAKKRGM